MPHPLRPALSLLASMTLLLGVAYPASVWVFGQVFLAQTAQGNPVMQEGRIIGFELIGQNFTEDKYFWPRPAAGGNEPYSFIGASASNLSAANPRLIAAIAWRAKHFMELNPQGVKQGTLLPVDLVTASGSGLDPHIAPRSAQLQVERVASARHLTPEVIHNLVLQSIEGRTFGFLGQPRINVLKLNLALDRMKGREHE